MAFLGIQTKKKAPAEKKVKAAKTKATIAGTVSPVVHDRAAETIIRPHITEKATIQNTANVYVFEVSHNATKKTVAEAVKALYKVVARKVAMVPIRRKVTFVKGKKGHTAGCRKAYVYLNKEDKIELV